jgi:hypothetical protein
VARFRIIVGLLNLEKIEQFAETESVYIGHSRKHIYTYYTIFASIQNKYIFRDT